MFTALLLSWVAFIFFAYDLRRDNVSWGKAALLVAVVVLVAGAIAKFTNHLLARPLKVLAAGISSVREGRLEPMQVSRTGDEVEYLGESFNAMIETLALSQKQVREYQELLEERIRQRTEALEEATQRALAASRTKSEFLANVSHELRTPLNGVLGMVEIVLDSELTAGQREELETAKGCANTLLALLNDILDLSKIEAGRMVLEQIPFDLHRLVDECVKSLVPKAQQKQIALHQKIAPEVPRQILGDPLRVRQVLINLLSNAVKFTDRGEVNLRLSLREPLAGEQVVVSIEVADTGAGIPQDKLASIFEEFTQADGSISRRYGGTGLGLAITRRLVHMHGGDIAVDSEEGRGSTFRVQLPFQPMQSAPVEVDIPPPGIFTNGSKIAHRHGYLLVVEDNLVNQKVVLSMLIKHGYQVDVVGNGKEALEALEASTYDLVLMDIQMPEMDGLEAAALIRQNPRWRDLPIVAMTAHAMQGDRERCLQAGMNGYIAKPVSAARLMAVIDSHLRMDARNSSGDGHGTELPPPIDSRLAERLMDNQTGLMRGMVLLFLQLAPERLEKLRTAAERLDVLTLGAEAQRLEKAADRIAAVEVARCAHQIREAAGAGESSSLDDMLIALQGAISRLDRHVLLNKESLAETAVSA